MSEPPRLPKFGRLPCFYQHLWCIVDCEGIETSSSACKAEIIAFIRTARGGTCGIRTPPSPWQGDTTTIIRHIPFCVLTKSRTLTKGLEDPCAFHYTIRTLAGTVGLEPTAFGLTGRSYFHTSYIPLLRVVDSNHWRIRLMRPCCNHLQPNPQCWHR